MHNTTTEVNIFDALMEVLKKYKLPLKKLVCLATDGTPTMTGITKEVVERLKETCKMHVKYKSVIKAEEMLMVLLVGAAIVALWYVFIRPLNHFKRMGVKQLRPWPILGNLYITILRISSAGDFVKNAYDSFGKSRYGGIYQFSILTLMVKDPELIKQLAIKDFDHFTDHRGFLNPESDPLWSNNLFTLTGQKWREMRATLSGSFTSSKMKHMFGVINEAAENFSTHFMNKEENLIELEMKDTFSRFTNDVIATSAFGLKVNSLEEPNNTFYIMGKTITSFNSILITLKFLLFFTLPRIFKYLKLSIFDKKTTAFFHNTITETIKVREEKNIVRKDMINLLLEARKGHKIEESNTIETGYATVQEDSYFDKVKFKQAKYLTNDDITSQALVFFFAGFDTVSTALCYGAHELALNKNIQDKLRREIRETHKLNDGKLTYDALLKMKYMDMVFSEILRKWPPAFSIDRVCTKPYTIEAKYPDEKPVNLKVGNVLWLPIFGLHRDPKYFPNPEVFDPERFSDENRDQIIPYSYIPFGVGPRNCIGSRFAILESKVLLYNLLLNFEIVSTKKTENPLKFKKGSFQNAVQGGYWVALKRIKQ
ncbi:hypothetical protein ABEB36_004290 [Hypothenemus hampei]|uniref:Cytochrome P450 n=1 Tax=Hypothenemus hampei TaxID=57062 RepID=A0ABD1F605_HYPHA